MPPRKTSVNLPRVKTDTLSDGRIGVTGDTFPIKDRLKAAGGRWHAGDKLWYLPSGTDLAFLKEPLPPPVPVQPWFTCCEKATLLCFGRQEFLCKEHDHRPWWLCCDKARIVSIQDMSCTCETHGDPHQSSFRVRGALYTGD